MKTIVSIILIVCGGLIFFLFTNPRVQAVQALRAEEQRFDEALTRSKELGALRDELLTKYNAIPTADLEKINALLPDAVDTVRLIIEINGIAARHGMTLLDISVGNVETGSADSGATLGPSRMPYGSVSLGFSVVATYDRFRAFLADLERNLRILDVDSISFSEADTRTGLTTFGVSFNTYWMK